MRLDLRALFGLLVVLGILCNAHGARADGKKHHHHHRRASAQVKKGEAELEKPAAQASGSSTREQSKEASAYKRTIAHAIEEYDAKNYEEALASFRKAHELSANARTLRGLGATEFELRRYPDSITHLEQALASSERPLDGKLRSETEGLLERARDYVGTYTLHITPESAEVVLDREPVDESALPTLTLTLGEHQLVVHADDYQPYRKTLKVQGGERQDLRITLKPSAPTPEATAALAMEGEDADRRDDDRKTRPLYKRPWFWVGVSAVVVAGAVIAGVFAAKSHGGTEVGAPIKTQHTPGNGVLTLALESRP